MQLTKNMGLFSIACLAYYVIGYNLMYPLGTWGIEKVLSGVWGVAVMEDAGVSADGVDDYAYAATASDYFFQLMFCAATASIVSGALAERIKLWPFLIFTALLTGAIYPLQASWKWGGGFLDAVGFLDFAGSTVVHSVGGWAALVGALILGPRLGKYKYGGVVPMLGSILPLATQLTYGKVDLTMVLNGALAGLVSITVEKLTPTMAWTCLIGGVGGLIVVFGVPLLDNVKIDDVVGAISVHLFADIWGTLAVVLTNPDAVLATQIHGILVVGAFTLVVSGAVWLILKATLSIRVSEEDEIIGLDSSELGMKAYPDFVR